MLKKSTSHEHVKGWRISEILSKDEPPSTNQLRPSSFLGSSTPRPSSFSSSSTPSSYNRSLRDPEIEPLPSIFVSTLCDSAHLLQVWSEGTVRSGERARCTATSVQSDQRSQQPAFPATSVHSNQRPLTNVHSNQRPQLAAFETFLPIGDNNPSQHEHTPCHNEKKSKVRPFFPKLS